MKVLFLGNSFTYYNSLPNMLSHISGGTIECASVTRGGAYLSEYGEEGGEVRTKLDALLASGAKFDYVVLQEQSLLPAKDSAKVTESAKTIVGLIPDTKFVMYQTWSYRRDTSRLGETGFTFEEMTERLAEGYRTAGAAIGASVVPVGYAFAEGERRGINLLSSDNFHPNAAGTYLAACVFYRAFTGRNAAGLPDVDEVSPEIAREVRKCANRIEVLPVGGAF